MEKPIAIVTKPVWIRPEQFKRAMIIRYGLVKVTKIRGQKEYKIWKLK
jgi:hypothetical protein